MIGSRRWSCSFLIAASLALMISCVGCRKTTPPPPTPLVPEVLFSLPEYNDVVDFEDFTGRTEALRLVDVRSRVSGLLQSYQFVEGTDVKKGDVLFEIDPRPFKATLDQSTAELEQSQAMLAKADADYRRANSSYSRQAISQSELDIAKAAFLAAKATVGISEAKLDQAKLDFEWTKVTAEISGQVSRRMIDPGNLIQAAVTPLTMIVAAEQIYIIFDIDERTVLRLRRLIMKSELKTRDQKKLSVLAALADEDRDSFPHEGVVDFSDNRVDPSTGTLRLRALFDNPIISTAADNKYVRRMMSPGLFARVRLPIGEPHKSILIPERAIGSDQGQKYVYIVNDKNEVVRSEITVGSLQGQLREILKGVGRTDKVIVSGVQRVRPKMKVKPTRYEEFVKTNKTTSSTMTNTAPASAPKTGSNP